MEINVELNYFTEILGWLGFVLILFGYYFNARQLIFCFYIWGVGNILINAMPQVAMSIFVLGMNIYGYIEWSKK